MKYLVILFMLLATAALAATDLPPGARLPRVAVPSPDSEAVMPDAPVTSYVLGTGDQIRLTVYGEDDLSGQYEVGSTGMVALPLIGEVNAAGRTIAEFESAVAARLKQGYLKDPRVSAQVANYRPFFILGEVSKPGSYPYVNGMTVLNAVALAGGYTYRADKDGVTITHAAAAKENDVRENAAVMPGDIIRVPERLF